MRWKHCSHGYSESDVSDGCWPAVSCPLLHYDSRDMILASWSQTSTRSRCTNTSWWTLSSTSWRRLTRRSARWNCPSTPGPVSLPRNSWKTWEALLLFICSSVFCCAYLKTRNDPMIQLLLSTVLMTLLVPSPAHTGTSLQGPISSWVEQSARRKRNVTNLAMTPCAPISIVSLFSRISTTVYNEILISFIYATRIKSPNKGGSLDY